MKLTPSLGGHIVFVASQGGLIGLYGLSTYCATKFALRGFAESLAMGKWIEYFCIEIMSSIVKILIRALDISFMIILNFF